MNQESYQSMYETLKREFEQYRKESIKWSIEDLIDYSNGYTLTPAEAQMALETMINDHQANFGITWDTVDEYKKKFGKPEFKHLGWANVWDYLKKPEPEEFKNCNAANHRLERYELGRCLMRYKCPICRISYDVDSSD